MLSQVACGFGSLALAGLHAQQSLAAPRNTLAERPAHHRPRAKRLIFIFMQGGPSQVDTYDPKTELDRNDGKKAEFFNSRSRKITSERVQKSPWRFSQHGESGRPVSELFPHMARHVDD